MGYAIRETLSRDECLSLLASVQVGRVGASIDDVPFVLPVNFIVLGGQVLFRTSSSSELLAASVGSVIAFEVDGYVEDGSYGWSVLVRGTAIEVTDRVELELARLLWLEAWPLGEQADRYVVIPTTIVSGRRFVRVQ